MIHPCLRNCLLAILLFVCCNEGIAQFNINKFNGLPTDHVYMFLKDRYGYLWIATNKGVLRYNGYEFKLFNTSQELGSSDVWRIYQDRKQRIWLYSFSNSFGYIYKNKYHKVIVQDEVIDPGHFVYETEDGIMLTKDEAIPETSPDSTFWLYYENYKPGKKMQCDVLTSLGKGIQLYHFNGDTFSLKKTCVSPPVNKLSKIYGNRMIRYRNHIFLFMRKKDYLFYHNLDSCTHRMLVDDKSGPHGFSYIQPPENRESDPRDYIYVYYKNRVEKRDSLLRLMETSSVKDLTRPGISGYELVYLLEDSLWGKCIATESHGGFITPLPANTPFKPYNWDATGFMLLKVMNDSIAYWWNEQSHILARVEPGRRPMLIPYNHMGGLTQIFEYNKQLDMLFTFSYYCTIDKRTGKLFHSPTYYYNYIPWYENSGSNTKVYSVCNQNLSTLVFAGEKALNKILLREKFKEVIQDPVRPGHWTYNQRALYFITRKDSCIPMKSLLKAFGIVQLEKFMVDASGNLLFLTPDKLICYHAATQSVSTLLTNCNLAGAKLCITGRTLVAAGRYGVAFTTVNSKGTYNKPVIYHNIKDNYYSYINDIQVLKDSLLLQTNTGAYIVGIPHNNKTYAQAQLPYNLLVQHADSTYSGSNYVVNTTRENNVLHFDLVRPAGNGSLRFMYQFTGLDSVWHELNGNALELYALKPGQQYNLAVIAKDDVWQSDAMNVQLYVKPVWWRTYPGLHLIWLAGSLFAGGTLLTTVLITRRLIEKRSARQKQLLELELKAVYAQINPHFIFNTLNSGLHFIKKQRTDEAYHHILRFSQLLRAYLKASRHRYITLAQEVQNLSTYIELQQTRFGRVFEYSITLDHIPDPEQISIPSLLLQPIVENAIEHGLLPKETHGRLGISFNLDSEKKQLICTVCDDGIGRTRSKQNKAEGAEKRESYGNDLIRELIHIFNKYEKMGIEISYSDLPEPHTGTSVKIVIKNPHITYE